MNAFRSALVCLASLFVICLSAPRELVAQSTIINAPSTDAVPAKHVYLEIDFLTDYAWQRNGSFQNYVPRAVVGVGSGVEAGANVSYTHVTGQSQPIELQPNIKWQIYRNESNGTAIAIGCILFAPLTHRAGTNTFGQCYSVASKQVSGRFGARFTGGAYALLRANEGAGTKVGAIFGYQQPITKKIGFVVDWSSGNNRFGFVSPALTFSTSGTSSLTTGYSIANHGRGKNALFAYYGIQF